jgi:L-ascorbate metabolism protein UlaG (beta-lactamase superfamily)
MKDMEALMKDTEALVKDTEALMKDTEALMKDPKTLLGELRAFKPEAGSIAFWWLGQMGFAIRAAGRLILVDAFLSAHKGRVIPPALDADEPELADFVLGTHDHTDHIDRAAWRRMALAGEKIRFVVPDFHRKSVVSELGISENRVIGVDENMPFSENGLTIRAIPSAHEFLDTDPATGRHPHLGYIIEADGLRIYHAGDSCIYEGMHSKLKQYGRFDVMFVPINGRDGVRYRKNTIGNMTAQEAVDLVGFIHPGLAVPGHYEMFMGNQGDPALFADYLDAKYPGIPCRIVEHGERIDVVTAG